MPLNPVERRLVQLREHWERFRADSSKRALIWRVPGNASRLTECFFETQKFEAEYSSGDLFIVFDPPFEHSIQYSKALKAALLGQYEASRADLEREGIPPDWAFEPDSLPDSATGFVQSLLQFGSKHHKKIGHLVAVLRPLSVSSDASYAAWIARCLGAGIPERLRLLFVDVKEAPRLDGLIADGDARIAVDEPAIDGLTTAQETFAQEGAVGPAAVFRNYLMGLATLLERGTSDQVRAKAADAMAFAQKQGWQDQQVVIGLMVAGALLKERRCDEAIATYQGARQSALAVATTGHPAGQPLVLQTLFGEAGALVAAGKWDNAASRYWDAATTARQIPNAILAIEASRMGLFCQARMQRREEALACGAQALADGRTLKPEARVMTSLPIAAVDLLRVLDGDRVATMGEAKRRLAARVTAAHEAAERAASSVETAAAPHRSADIELTLAGELAAAHQQGDRELVEIAGGGDDEFRGQFTQIRELLASNWPESFFDGILLAAESEPVAAAAGAPRA